LFNYVNILTKSGWKDWGVGGGPKGEGERERERERRLQEQTEIILSHFCEKGPIETKGSCEWDRLYEKSQVEDTNYDVFQGVSE
jgi:hypothetical protein